MTHFCHVVQVGVHIADVTHFCHADSAMDKEAALRSTTVYLVDKRIDMLPKPLTEDICRRALLICCFAADGVFCRDLLL